MRAFLSHSSNQKKLVNQIASNLGKAQCVYDEYEFEAGLPILDEILKGLEISDLFVLFISNDSLSSEWVQKEISSVELNLEYGKNKKIFPILIDNSISVVDDERIPEWLKKYLLKTITDPFIITKKIKQKLRELSLESNPLFKAKESLFVGRNDLFDSFESKIFSISDQKSNSIVVSGFEGIGRRTFLKTALKRSNKIQEYYEPIYITLDTKDSIEDFIIKLQDFDNETSSNFLSELEKLSYLEKVEEAKSLLVKVQDSNEVVFIIDSGCIILPTMKVAPWYLELISNQKHQNVFSLCVISRFRPSNGLLKINKDIIHFHLSTLNEKDTEKLFVKYSNLLELDLTQEDSQSILSILNGIPAQVHYSVEYIKEYGITEALKKKDEIIDFGETQVFYLINMVKSRGKLAYDLLVLLSNFEFVSYDLIYSIIEDEESIDKLLEEFYIIGVYDLVGANKEYIKLHYAVRDFLNRSKQKLNPIYSKKLKNHVKEFVSRSEENSDFKDISDLLFSVKGAILEGHQLPQKYYIPSFVLKTIVELYYKGNYANVIKLVDGILDNPNKLDESLLREFRYWLCLSLARTTSSRFELEVQNLDGSDYNFLYGFYYRFKRDYDKALRSINFTLEKNPNFQRAKRELVNILLLKEEYQKALEASKTNYDNQKLNAFHIQSYFICLIRKPYLSKDDRLIFDELFKNIERSYDSKSKEIASVMKGEYEYYVNKDTAKAILILRECIKNNSSKHYPTKALREIYQKTSMNVPYNDLTTKNIEVIASYLD